MYERASPFINGWNAQIARALLAVLHLKDAQLRLDNVLLDPQSSTMRQLGTNGVPSTYFLNSDGELVDTHFGALSSASLKSNLKAIKP